VERQKFYFKWRKKMRMPSFSSLKALSLGVVLGLAQLAQAGVTGKFHLTSDYVWRGQSQSAHSPAVQGALNYEHESGLTVGTWLSNIVGASNGVSQNEQRVYAAYTHKVNADVELSGGVTWYNYPTYAGRLDNWTE